MEVEITDEIIPQFPEKKNLSLKNPPHTSSYLSVSIQSYLTYPSSHLIPSVFPRNENLKRQQRKKNFFFLFFAASLILIHFGIKNFFLRFQRRVGVCNLSENRLHNLVLLSGSCCIKSD